MAATPVLEKTNKKTVKSKSASGLNGAALHVDISEFANRTFPDPLGRSWEQVLIDREEILSKSQPERLPPHGMTVMEHIIGKWPGDETDEQIEEALRWIS